MEKPKTFWQECYENTYAQGMSRPTEELVAEFNELMDSPVFAQSVTARITAFTALFRFRGYDLKALQSSSGSLKLQKVRVEDGKILPLD